MENIGVPRRSRSSRPLLAVMAVPFCFFSLADVKAVTLSGPHGGEAIPSGSVTSIVWSATPAETAFTLKYSLNNGRTWAAVRNTDGVPALKVSGRTFAWKVPPVSRNKRGCLVKIVAYSADRTVSGTDRSHEPFTVEVLKLTHPDGGEHMRGGGGYSIAWNSYLTTHPVAKVLVFYATDSGRIWKKIGDISVAPGDPLPQSYLWSVPVLSEPANSCRVKVLLKNIRGVSVGEDSSDGVFTIGPPDLTPPYVLSTAPPSGAANLPVSATISAVFSEEMDPSTLSEATFLLTGEAGPVAGTVGSSGATATFTPLASLLHARAYTATIASGVRDLAGNPMATAYSWSFTTEAAVDNIPPTVSSTVPDRGAADVPVSTLVVAVFSEALDPSTVNADSFVVTDGENHAVSGSVTYADRNATFSPSANLSGLTTYSATLTSAVRDIAGNPMAVPYTWTFTTGAGPDVTPPRIIATTPQDGAIDVGLDQAITARFSEEMNASSLDTGTFHVRSAGQGFFGGEVSYAGLTATFTPVQFTYDTLLIASVTTGALDLAGNPMASSFSWQFRTVAPPEATLDQTFGAGGAVTSDLDGSTDLSGNGARVTSMIIQPDGKIVAAGPSYRGPDLLNEFAVARYNVDGTIDLAFGTFGKVVQGFGGDDYLSQIVRQADGKLVAVGSSYVGCCGNVVLVRYGADGSPDPSFGAGGVVTLDLGGNDAAFSVGLQSDGRIVVAATGSSGDCLARLEPDGTRDMSFGIDGCASGSGRRLAIQDDDKIVVVSWTGDFVVRRFTPDGALDTTFGTGGVVETDFLGGQDRAEAVAIRPDGRITVAGSAIDPSMGSICIALARYGTDGSLDSSFGTGGKAVTCLGGLTSGEATDVSFLTGGRIVVVGGALGVTASRGDDFALVGYNEDGTPDTSLAAGGKAFTDLGRTTEWFYALGVQADGKIVAAGRSGGDLAIVRYLPNGGR